MTENESEPSRGSDFDHDSSPHGPMGYELFFECPRHMSFCERMSNGMTSAQPRGRRRPLLKLWTRSALNGISRGVSSGMRSKHFDLGHSGHMEATSSSGPRRAAKSFLN